MKRPARILSIAVRICLALAIVYWVADQADMGRVIHQARAVQPRFLVLILLLLLVENLVKVFNWKQVLAAMLGRAIGYLGLLRANLAGCFLGSIVPSSAGTDAIRALYSRNLFGGHIVVHAASMVALNVLNWFAGSLLGLVMLVLLYRQEDFVVALGFVALILAAVVTAVPCVYFLLRMRRNWLLLSLRGVGRKWFKLRHSARKFIDALLIFEQAHINVAPVLLTSLASVVAQGLAWTAAGAGLGVALPLSCWILMVPVNGIANMVPLSISGFGFNQAAHLAVMGAFGVQADQAVAVSALMALGGTIYNLAIGGTGFATSQRLRPTA